MTIASWWRSNRLALLALVLLVPAIAGLVGWSSWYNYFGYGARPVHAVDAAPKETVELQDAEWGPIRSGIADNLSSLDVPPNTQVIIAAVPVDPGSEGVYCSQPVLVQQSTGREWLPVREEIGLDYNLDEPDTCDSGQTAPYELIVAYVVPEDVEGPFWVEVSPGEADGRFVRFSIDP